VLDEEAQQLEQAQFAWLASDDGQQLEYSNFELFVIYDS
jgi:hypothetical protein